MSNSLTDEMPDSVEHSLDVVARSLRDAAELTKDLSEEASVVFAKAAADVVRLAERQRKQAVRVARVATRQAAQEFRRHPIASFATALAAVAAIVGMISANRSNRNATK